MTAGADENAFAKSKPMRLNFEDSKSLVLVTPEDKDCFVTTAQYAARACSMVMKSDDQLGAWQAEFERFLAWLNLWSSHNPDVVDRTYVVAVAHGLEVYVVTQGTQYRFEFDDDITGLDLELVERFPTCPAHVMQIPSDTNENLEAIFSSSAAWQVYGN
jgi:hypothetical protein